MKLDNLGVVITGGAKGLGKSLVFAFSREGARVVVGDIEESNLDQARPGGAKLAVRCDVTRADSVQDLYEESVATLGAIDMWVNNAGIWMPHMPLEQFDINSARKMFEVNLWGTVYGTKVALMNMKSHGSGTIMNIISVSALCGRPKSSLYCASKFAVNGFTKSVALEAKDSNVAVLSVFPGYMKTGLFGEAKPAGYDSYLEPDAVAQAIIDNLKLSNPIDELVIDGK